MGYPRIFKRRMQSFSGYNKVFVKNDSANTGTFDKWLQRISHISQFGLFLFTVVTIYFTVVPLYQKALLDEAIAKKEIELNDVNKAYENIYKLMRSTVVGQYIFQVGAQCSGLFLPLKLDRELESQMPSSSLNGKNLSSEKNAPHVSDLNIEGVFGIDVPACLIDVTKGFESLKKLRVEDRNLIDKNVLIIGKELITIRQHAMSEYETVTARATKNINTFSRPKGFTGLNLERMKNIKTPEQIKKHTFEATIFWEKLRIENAYGDQIRNKISTIKDIDWPK